jgi:hypothetical protein
MKDKQKTFYKENISNKKIALYMNYALGTPPLELHLATIYDLLSRNNIITVYVCKRSLKACTANALNSPTVCNYCHFRAKDALKDVSKRINIVDIDINSMPVEVPAKKVDSLKLGVMSSMASAVKAQNYDQLNTDWKGFYEKLLQSSKKLYNYFILEIEKNAYDFVFMFNGRFGDVKPVLEATRAAQVGYGLYEVKKSLHEIVFINELIHSIDGNTRRAIKNYLNNPDKAIKDACEFYGKKLKNESTGDPVYTAAQERGELPSVLNNTTKKIIAVYPTTDDEYKFIGKEWDGYVPEDQVDEIDKLVSCLRSSEYVVIIKMHPNQAHTAENVVSRYMQLEQQYNHVFVEPPLSTKDTYALMWKADYIINFASTIGVEACYAGKIVISIGDTTFSKMNTSYRVKSGDAAADLIVSEKLKPKPVRGAIIWGAYLASYSDRLPMLERIDNGVYLVNGKKIGVSRLLRLIQLPAKLILEMKKPGFVFDLVFFKKAIHIISNVIFNKWKVK